jgi:hypothetical protein
MYFDSFLGGAKTKGRLRRGRSFSVGTKLGGKKKRDMV